MMKNALTMTSRTVCIVIYGKVLQKLEYALSDTFQVCCYHAYTAESVDGAVNREDRGVIRGFHEQIFRRAAAVVGVHGAGLSNILFSAAAATATGTRATDASAALGAGSSARASTISSSPQSSSSFMSSRQKLIEIVPGASSFHTEYALLAGTLGMDHHAYVIPDVGWGDDVKVPSPKHLAAVVRAALLPEEIAGIATRGWDSVFEKLHGSIRRSHLKMIEDDEDPGFHDVKPFRDRGSKFK